MNWCFLFTHPPRSGRGEVVSCSLCSCLAALPSCSLRPGWPHSPALQNISQQMTGVSWEGRWPGALASFRSVRRASPRKDRMDVFTIWVPEGLEVQSSPRTYGEQHSRRRAQACPALQHGSHSPTHPGLAWSPVRPPFSPPISWSQAQSSASDRPGSNPSSFALPPGCVTLGKSLNLSGPQFREL